MNINKRKTYDRYLHPYAIKSPSGAQRFTEIPFSGFINCQKYDAWNDDAFIISATPEARQMRRLSLWSTVGVAQRGLMTRTLRPKSILRVITLFSLSSCSYGSPVSERRRLGSYVSDNTTSTFQRTGEDGQRGRDVTTNTTWTFQRTRGLDSEDVTLQQLQQLPSNAQEGDGQRGRDVTTNTTGRMLRYNKYNRIYDVKTDTTGTFQHTREGWIVRMWRCTNTIAMTGDVTTYTTG